jgi:hypothetical protein
VVGEVGQAGGTCFCGWGGNKQWWSNLRVTEVDFVTIVPKKKCFKNETNLFIIKGYKQFIYSKYPFSYLELHSLTHLKLKLRK